MKLKLAVLCALGFAALNASACYTLYDAQSRVIYQGVDAPVDMSYQLHDTVQRRWPGSQLVFDQSNRCAPVSLGQVSRPTAGLVPVNTIQFERSGRRQVPASNAPLLTDRRTAASLNLPYTPVEGQVVMVSPEAAANMRPGVNVIPAAQFAGAPDTTTLGAGPAPVKHRKKTVITEMHNPPMTVIQQK